MMMKSCSSTIIALATVVLVVTATTTDARNTALSSSLRALAPASTTAAAAADSNQRIVGGNESDEGEFPYYVGMGGCGGALIAPSVVLFAAHCQDFKDQQVNVGSFKRRSSNFGAQPAFCDVWIDDPTFGNGGSSINNDFALCLLDRDVIIDQTKVKLILNTNPAVPASSGDDLTVMGLGTLSAGGDSPGFVHDVTVPTIPNANCSSPNSYNGQITDAMLCAGFSDGGKDSCQGDSGGPIVRPITLNDGTIEHTHVGVVSWGYGCADATYPGVYARTSSGSSWIIDQVCNIWNASADFCDNNTNTATATTDVFENCDQQLLVELVTDVYGFETSSILQEQNGDTILERKYLVESYNNEHKVCLKSNTCYNYIVRDNYGDGMCTSNGCGSFKLELNGVLKISGNPEFISESPTYEICTGGGGGPPPVTDPTPSPIATTPLPTTSPATSSAPVTDPTPSPVATTTPPTPSPVATSSAPVVEPTTESQSPAEAPVLNTYVPVSDPLVDIATDCENGQIKFQVKIGIDSYGGETYWELVNNDEQDVIIAGANRVYEANRTYFDPSDNTYFCLDGGEYVFKMKDGYGDGLCCDWGPGYYEGYVNGRMVFDGGEFGSEETQTFTVEDSFNVPSDGPTQLPTGVPTGYPTPADTFDDVVPTDKPTTDDTSSPSVSPTDEPTAFPTEAPSDAPTGTPTDAPTSFPTFLPTAFPTQGCVDSTGIVFKNKKCNFVKGNKLNKIRKKCKKKRKGVKVFDACPLSCGKKAGLGRCDYLYQSSNKNKDKNKKKNKNKNKN